MTEIRDRVLDGPRGESPGRVYAPDPPMSAGLVWLHGGGFMAGGLDMPEAHWVAGRPAEVGVAVVSVRYRLAPVPERFATWAKPRSGVRFPVASEDIEAAFEWAREHGPRAPARSLGGARAGADLTAGVSTRLRDRRAPLPRSRVLVYPLVHRELPRPSSELAAKLSALPPEAVHLDESHQPEAARSGDRMVALLTRAALLGVAHASSEESEPR